VKYQQFTVRLAVPFGAKETPIHITLQPEKRELKKRCCKLARAECATYLMVDALILILFTGTSQNIQSSTTVFCFKKEL
jgi:hypothetical protein